ncbi:DNA replication/repair protein RecF [Thermogemmatispora onikobensis]|uniref:DNA replication/repair protein RecF n=1 Tax=Thermogemmatispora onikobensis TaxID=732234 RepID=UPI0008536DA1|nr:DNA replication/repair protein RecF [Thermogemmatispora onikobensis]
MHLVHLALTDFRNYRQLDLPLGPGLFLFCGDNAQGKTNLLEAVSMIATSTSFHATADREVVNWYAPDHLARLDARVRRRDGELHVEIVIFDPTPPLLGSGEQAVRPPHWPGGTQRKRIKINEVPRRALDLIGSMTNVLFAPADLHLVDGSPDERRRFIDRSLCQVRPRYCQALQQYRKVTMQRAALLKRIRDYHEDPRLLDYLDERLTLLATMIMFERERMLSALNELAAPFQEQLSGGREQLQIVYRPSFQPQPQRSLTEAQEHYLRQLHAVRQKEIHQGVCLLGPHRDDLEFLVNGMSVITYGSRGQQRTVALATKFAELAYMRAATGDEPVLLLDDVFSELDQRRREQLLQAILDHEQVLLTTTDAAHFPPEVLERASKFQVVNGQLHPW